MKLNTKVMIQKLNSKIYTISNSYIRTQFLHKHHLLKGKQTKGS